MLHLQNLSTNRQADMGTQVPRNIGLQRQILSVAMHAIEKVFKNNEIIFKCRSFPATYAWIQAYFLPFIPTT